MRMLSPQHLLMILAIASAMATVALGFATNPMTTTTTTSSMMLQKRSSGVATTTELSAAAKTYPAMSRDEVQAMLDTVPVYAVTEPNQEGLVLLKEKNNPNDIAYFFFSPDAALTVFSPLRKKENEAKGNGEWSVSAYPLGLVWFELINDPEQQSQGVEYRLLPEPDDLIGAQNLLREQEKQSKQSNPRINELFRAPYNDIPVFVDQFLRVTAKDESTGDNREKVPMYIGLKDLMNTCNQAIKASSGEYQAAMSAIDLKDLIGEMTKENSNDYRRAVMVPPTQAKEGEPTTTTTAEPAAAVQQQQQEPEDPFGWDGKQGGYGRLTMDPDDITTPTASNDWSD